VLNSIKNNNLSKYLNNIGYVSHNESIKYQKNSQLLLLVEINSEETKAIIPGKLFEYMVAERPIVALGPKDSDVEQILKETNTGDYFGYNDYDGLKAKIIQHFEAFKKGELLTHPIGLQKYSRKSLTQVLATLIKSI